MTRLLLALLIAATCQSGTLSSYAPAPTRAVIANRSVPGRTAWTLPNNWREYDVLVAVSDCSRLGETGTIAWREHGGTYLVFDCAGDAATRAWMRRNNVIGEVGYDTAKAWRSIGRGMMGATMCRTVEK